MLLFSPQLTTTLLRSYLQQFLLLGTSCPSIKKKKITKHAKRQKYNLKFKSIRTRYSRMLEFSDQEFKTAMVNILKALIKQIKCAICAYRGFPGGTGGREPAC